MGNLTEVLRLMNVGREAIGLPTLAQIPSGTPVSAGSCPLARSLAVNVGTCFVAQTGVLYSEASDGRLVSLLAKAWSTSVDYRGRARLPEVLVDFIYAFDNRDYPHLVLS